MRWAAVTIIVAAALAAVAASTLLFRPDGDEFTGETVAVPTFEPVPFWAPCPDAEVNGVLAADPEWGLVLHGTAWGDLPAIWPHGFFALRDGGTISLLSASHHIVAREGDRINTGGGVVTVNGIDLVRVCSEIRVDAVEDDP
jgi:hypothetical protein